MTLTLEASSGLADETPRVTVRGVPNGAYVRIDMQFRDDTQVEWLGRGEYFADEGGTVDIARAASVGGTYTGVDPRGLLWSAVPNAQQPEEDRHANHSPPRGVSSWIDPTRPVEMRFTAVLLEGASRAPCPSAVTTYRFLRVGSDVKVTPVREGRLRGILYEPRARSFPVPATLVLSGSNGGIPAATAAMLASRGIAAFALGAFAYEDLPQELESIPLEYFQEGALWLASQCGRARVGVVGGSRGGELSLLLAATFPEQFSTVVALSAVHIVNGSDTADGVYDRPAWTLKFAPVPFNPMNASKPFIECLRESTETHRPYYLDSWTEEADARYGIPVERSRAAILMLSGRADEVWPASVGSERVIRRLRDHAYALPYRHVAYEGAGHWITRASGIDFSGSDRFFHPILKFWIPLGGLPASNAHASLSAFGEMCGWLREHAV